MLPKETVILAGPTGTGKTALALRLAQRLGGLYASRGAGGSGVEIVGADAFQIYAGLPLLTAQPSATEQAAIPHHLVGAVDPRESYDAGRWLREVKPILQAIVARGRIPLVVGGTGLYVKALMGGLDELPGNDPALRASFAGVDLPALVERLRAVDPEAIGVIDLLNRRRVERALEIILLTGKPLAASRTSSKTATHSSVRALLVLRDREELQDRIAANVAAMFERGVEAEVAALPEEKIGPTAAMTLGLREIRSLLRGESTQTEAQEAITTATRRYAKRQLTWFRNQHDFPQLNLSLIADPDQAVEAALKQLNPR